MSDLVTDIQTGVTVSASLAEAVAPIVAIYNPGAGAAMQLLAPVAEQFILRGVQLVVDFKKDMSTDDMIKALEASKSVNWGTPGSVEKVV